MKNLETKLLEMGGIRTDLYVTGWPESTYGLVESGKLFDPIKENPVLLKLSKNRCHDNVALLWSDFPELEVWTGFALSQSGVWQNHSWCFHPVWKILVETAVPFMLYYGLQLSPNVLRLDLGDNTEVYRKTLGLPQNLNVLLRTETHRTCNKCGVEKLLREFRLNPLKGRRLGCRECERTAHKKSYYLNPEKHAAAARKWSKDHPEQRNATKRAWCKRNPAKHKAMVHRTVYGLEPEGYTQLLFAQNNKCAICSLNFEKTNRVNTPHVDHCHVTNKVRGLLCGNCNSGIGKLKDNFSILIRAADYIRKNS